MSLITVSYLSKSFDPVDIFQDISFQVPKNARVAIVGPNGIGKTTLLRILIGLDKPTSGNVAVARGIKLGYLPQEASFVSTEQTLWKECLGAFTDLREMEMELSCLEKRMADPDSTEDSLARYGPLQAEFERLGGYMYMTRIQQVLTGLGFIEKEFHYPLGNLSGGQRTRALLATLLLSDPDVLILDEPTNHLDIQAVEWLEGYLSQWEGAAVIVSHDRYFLDRAATLILEMNRAGMETYRGNYSAYLEQRQARWERRQEVFQREQERLLKEVDYIKRNISGQNVSQAKGRLRRLSRILQAVDQVGLEAVLNQSWSQVSENIRTTVSPMSPDEAEQKVRGMHAPSNRPLILHLKLKPDQRSGEIILRAKDLDVGYPDNSLFTIPDLELRRLECAALIGPNGAGKTTFLKTILGQLPPLQGDLHLGASLGVGYFAQAHEELHSDLTLVQEIDAVAPHMLEAEIRSYLARYLFTGEDVYKKVEVLSGGERGRLALAKLALSNANLLLLDEPSNHLDIPAQEVLQEVLATFGGTIILVSHDRYLIDALATQVWEIDDRESSLTIYKGTYSEYRVYLDQKRQEEKVLPAERLEKRKAAVQKNRGPSRNQERQRKSRLLEIEKQITELESKLLDLSYLLENPPKDPEKIQKLGLDYVSLQTELEQKMGEWERLAV